MASITCYGNALKRIQFIAPDGARRGVRLGKASDKTANAVPDGLYTLVSTSAAQNPAQQPPEMPRNGAHGKKQNPQETQETAITRNVSQVERVSEGTRTPDPKDHNLVL